MNKALSLLAVMIGVVLIIAGVVYFVTPANSLPAIVPGYDPGAAKTHLKHGVVSLVLGMGFWAYAWFLQRRKSLVSRTG